MFAPDIDPAGFDRLHLRNDIDDDGMESPVALVHCDACGATGRTTNPAQWHDSHERCIGGRLFEAAS